MTTCSTSTTNSKANTAESVIISLFGEWRGVVGLRFISFFIDRTTNSNDLIGWYKWRESINSNKVRACEMKTKGFGYINFSSEEPNARILPTKDEIDAQQITTENELFKNVSYNGDNRTIILKFNDNTFIEAFVSDNMMVGRWNAMNCVFVRRL